MDDSELNRRGREYGSLEHLYSLAVCGIDISRPRPNPIPCWGFNPRRLGRDRRPTRHEAAYLSSWPQLSLWIQMECRPKALSVLPHLKRDPITSLIKSSAARRVLIGRQVELQCCGEMPERNAGEKFRREMPEIRGSTSFQVEILPHAGWGTIHTRVRALFP